MCKHGHFIDTSPIFGECRFNPPRPVIDKKNATVGRNFVQVKFDDWCGKLAANETNQKMEQLKNLVPYLSDNDAQQELKYKEAKERFAGGDYREALKIFEPLFQVGKIKKTMLNRISTTLCELRADQPEDEDLKSLSETWQCRAESTGGPEASTP